MRNSLFGEGKISEDMNFDWVNKDNIHNVYQQFVHTVEDNKDYSREDWDEVKLMYEALDSRKTLLKRRTYFDDKKNCWFKIKICSNVH
jgi:hypothetical protein